MSFFSRFSNKNKIDNVYYIYNVDINGYLVDMPRSIGFTKDFKISTAFKSRRKARRFIYKNRDLLKKNRVFNLTIRQLFKI